MSGLNQGINQNIDSVVDNFNGGIVRRNDLAPAIVFSVAVSHDVLPPAETSSPYQFLY